MIEGSTATAMRFWSDGDSFSRAASPSGSRQISLSVICARVICIPPSLLPVGNEQVTQRQVTINCHQWAIYQFLLSSFLRSASQAIPSNLPTGATSQFHAPFHHLVRTPSNLPLGKFERKTTWGKHRSKIGATWGKHGSNITTSRDSARLALLSFRPDRAHHRVSLVYFWRTFFGLGGDYRSTYRGI